MHMHWQQPRANSAHADMNEGHHVKGVNVWASYAETSALAAALAAVQLLMLGALR